MQQQVLKFDAVNLEHCYLRQVADGPAEIFVILLFPEWAIQKSEIDYLHNNLLLSS